MKIASWNVNSIRARKERLLRWLTTHQPDVLCLQELKTTDKDYPFDDLKAVGYHSAMHGQKTYNGVAILTRSEPADVERGFGDGGDDAQSRLIAARVAVPGAPAGTAAVRVVSVYVPNGSEVGSDKWAYKLEWLRRLRAWLDQHASPSEPLVVCGDFNVAPEAKDVHDPAAWEPTVLFHPEARKALETVCAWGLRDSLRVVTQDPGLYSWWDYRMLAFPRNNGLRIDLILATEPMARRCTAASIDRDERKGQQPSDHAPVIAEFANSPSG